MHVVNRETFNTSTRQHVNVTADSMCCQAGLNLIQVRKLQLQIRQWLEDGNHVWNTAAIAMAPRWSLDSVGLQSGQEDHAEQAELLKGVLILINKLKATCLKGAQHVMFW